MFDDPWCGSIMPEIAGFGSNTDNIPLISQILHIIKISNPFQGPYHDISPILRNNLMDPDGLAAE